MVQRVSTVAFEGIEVRPVDVQVQVAPGMPAFAIVGLPDKAVSEARERVRSALIASGLALPARRITINLAPADMPKEGSHYDLPIALGLMRRLEPFRTMRWRDYRSGRTRPRRLDLSGRRRTAGGDWRQCPRRGLMCRPSAGQRPPGRAQTSTSSPRPRSSNSPTISRAPRCCHGRSRKSSR